MRTFGCLGLTLALSVLASGFAVLALAEEVDPGKEIAERLTELRKLGDAAGLMEALGQAPEIYRELKSPSLRSKIRKEMGRILRDEDLGDARVAAIDALVAIEDPKSAWKELAKAMPSPKVEEAAPFDVRIVKAAGELAQTRASKILLDLVANAQDVKIGVEAAKALGGYRKDRRSRVKILEDMLALGKRLRPGTAPDKPVSQEAVQRWEAMGPALVVGMNTLTGQLLAAFPDWEALHKEFKRTPKRLFLED